MHTAKNRNISHRKTDKGAILVVVLIVMISLLGLGMTGLFLTSGSIQMNTNINLRNQALVVAEAGIERARGVLNNPNWTPPVPALLAGSNPPPAGDDEVPQVSGDKEKCRGELRGAIMVDQITPSCVAPASCPLQNISFPSGVDRTADLPASAGAIALQSMGTYTVYIRQDPSDCRMGNFTCENAPQAVDGNGVPIPAQPGDPVPCTPVAGTPPPNGAVVIRSEGVASDQRTRVVLEVTMTPNQGAAQANNTPMSALCAAGAAGCDDNASVQTGIVVNSNNPQTPPSYGGAGGSEGGAPGTGGATGAGGATGTGGGAIPGGTGGGGAGGGTGGATGTGGVPGTGGSAPQLCPTQTCSRIAIMGVPGIWDDKTTATNPRDSLFANWLTSHDNSCTQIGTISYPITMADLNKYSVIIMRDLFHSAADRTACLQAQGTVYNWNPGTSSYDLLPASSGPDPCRGGGTYGVTRCYPKPGKQTLDNVKLCTSSVADALQICIPRDASVAAAVSANCTSYYKGSAPVLTNSDIMNIVNWAKNCTTNSYCGIATTVGFYGNAVEAGNINGILANFNLRYATDGFGRIVNVLGGVWDATHSGGVNVGQHGNPVTQPATAYTDFVSGAPPFAYANPVTLLQVRAAVPLQILPGTPTPMAFATVQSQECLMSNLDYTGFNPGSACPSYTGLTECTSGPPASTDGLPRILGARIQTGKARVVAWADEWLTYDTVWETKTNCGQVVYQPDLYWDNVVRYLANCQSTGNGSN